MHGSFQEVINTSSAKLVVEGELARAQKWRFQNNVTEAIIYGVLWSRKPGLALGVNVEYPLKR